MILLNEWGKAKKKKVPKMIVLLKEKTDKSSIKKIKSSEVSKPHQKAPQFKLITKGVQLYIYRKKRQEEQSERRNKLFVSLP